MKYAIRFKPWAVKDLEAFSSGVQQRVLAKIEQMSDNFSGDIKKLTDKTQEYRLRVGNYRVLFEIERDTIVIYRIKHRREAYR